MALHSKSMRTGAAQLSHEADMALACHSPSISISHGSRPPQKRKRDTASFGPTQDQKFRFYSDGVKTNRSTAQKNRGGLGGRRALNDDVSNPGKPSAQQHQQQGVKKSSQGKQSITVVAEDENFPDSFIEAEGLFFHDHEKCIQSQFETKGFPQFSKETNRIDDDVCFESMSACKPIPRQSISKVENSVMIFEMDEIQVPISEDLPGGSPNSPIGGSPNSLCGYPSPPALPDFCILGETP